MTKNIAIISGLALSIFASGAHAGASDGQRKKEITCKKDGVLVEVMVDVEYFGLPNGNNYYAYKNGKGGSGALRKVYEGFEGELLNSYVWVFEGIHDDSMIAIASPELDSPKTGHWSGKADIDISSADGDITLNSADCTIVIP